MNKLDINILSDLLICLALVLFVYLYDVPYEVNILLIACVVFMVLKVAYSLKRPKSK